MTLHLILATTQDRARPEGGGIAPARGGGSGAIRDTAYPGQSTYAKPIALRDTAHFAKEIYNPSHANPLFTKMFRMRNNLARPEVSS